MPGHMQQPLIQQRWLSACFIANCLEIWCYLAFAPKGFEFCLCKVLRPQRI